MPLYSDINIMNSKLGNKLYDQDSIFQAIYTLLGTKIGERVFRPTYGSRLDKYLFEPCDNITAERILIDINETLKQDPRVNFLINESSVIPIPEKKAFSITIIFALIGFSDTKKSLQLMLAR